MDSLGNYSSMRAVLRSVSGNATRFSPKFRDGSANADWVEKGIYRVFDLWQAKLTALWLLSDNTHTLAFSDFELTPGEDVVQIEARLRSAEWSMLQGSETLSTLEASMTERNRSKLVAFFRADMENPGLAVGGGLVAVRNAMDVCRDAAAVAIPPTGDIDYFKREVGPGNEPITVVKTLAEMGVNGVPLADSLDLLAGEIALLVPVP